VKGGERGLWAIFRWPVGLGLLTMIGLLAALLGDGPWDALSWLLLAAPLAIGVGGLLRASGSG